MKSNSSLGWQILPAALLIVSAAIFTLGQTTKTNRRPEQSNATPPPTEQLKTKAEPTDSTKYSYEFTQPQFYVRHMLIEHDSVGRAQVTFERQNEDVPVVEKFEISPTALTRILGLYDALNFLGSQTQYQSDKQFPHLGTMKITAEQGTRKRTVEFNWTNDKNASALVNEYRRIGDQATFVFDMSVARENQPLNAPKLMEGLETLLKRDGLSDPQQLVPLLKEISTDDHVPLIARNHALRLLKKIDTDKK